MQKKANSKSKEMQLFDINTEANRYYPKQDSYSTKGMNMYARPRNFGSLRGKSSSFRVVNC